MARAVLRDIVFGLAATGLLIGCVEGAGKGTAGDGSGVVSTPARKAGARDVEAPEVFQTTDSALWDGRPSLGGIWVAAPDVTNPERAVMFNPATGKTVTGALFKRERDNPGPRLQLSSDAAEALGILAGQPTEIRVTALRKEEIEAPAPTEEAAAPGDGATDAATKPEGKDGEAAAIASAALDAVDAGKPAAAASADPAAAPADGSGDAAAAAAGAAAATADAVAPDATPKKKTWKERRAEAKAAREAKKRAAAEAKAATAAAGTVPAEGETPADGEAPVASPDAAAAAVAPIESAPLDARKPEAAAPAETKPPKRKTVGDAPAPAAAEATAAGDAAPAVSDGPARPIQVASFSKEENAKRAAEALAKIGVTATPQKSEKAGKAVWGVVVMGDDAMLKKIRDAGFADAYYLK